MSACEVSGPGILFAHSKISQPDAVNVETYLKWYWSEHIPDVVNTGGVSGAFFYINVDEKAERPYLALYPLDDMTFLKSDQFKKIRVHSALLPGTGLCYDYADVDIRYYKQIQTHAPNIAMLGLAKTMIATAIEPGDDTSAEDLDNWYREEHVDALSKVKGYLRTTRYQLTFARSNAQSRVLKGLATEEEKKAKLPEPPTWLALHEFETQELDQAILRETAETEWSKRILRSAKEVNHSIYSLVHTNSKGVK